MGTLLLVQVLALMLIAFFFIGALISFYHHARAQRELNNMYYRLHPEELLPLKGRDE